MATNGKRNRAAGHAYELEVVNLLKTHGFPHVVSSRSENRTRDGEKIDLVNSNEFKNGRLPYNIQCKSVTGKLAYHKVLSEIAKEPEVINVVFHRQTEKVGTRFMAKDRFSILYQADFLKIISELERYKKAFDLFNAHFEYIPEEERIKLDEALKKLGI